MMDRLGLDRAWVYGEEHVAINLYPDGGEEKQGGCLGSDLKMFSSQSKTRVVQLRTTLNQCKKENKTVVVLFD
jgi:hypothetical protein